MEKYLPVLRECPLFFGIDEADLVRMLGCLEARVAQFDKHYTVFAEGAAARHVGIVLSGQVQVVQVDYYGNRNIITVISPSQLVGEAFACAETAALPITVVASEPCEVMLIDRDRVLHTCRNGCGFHHQLIYNLMRDLAEKAILFHRKVDVLARRTTREKLMAYLMWQAKEAGGGWFRIPFDRQGLADYLAVDRSGLSAEIGKLRREGVLENRRSEFRLI